MRLTRRQFLGSLATLLSAPLAGCWYDQTDSDSLVSTVFNFDKSDAILIQQGSHNLLVDTGLEDYSSVLVSRLRSLGVSSLDALIITHFDRDHVGGAEAVLKGFNVASVYQSNSPKESDEYDNYLKALTKVGITPTTVFNTNVSFSLGLATVVINGPAEYEYENDPSNNSSLITNVSFENMSYLLMGDAEKARIKEFIASYSRPGGKLALKVPYHGHTQGQLDELIEATKPDVAVITNGSDEPTADEIAEVTDLFEAAGADVYCTSDGTVTLNFVGSEIIASQ